MRKLVFIAVCFFFSANIFAQEKLNNQSVLQMISLGLSEEIIIEKINSEFVQFDTSTQALVSLKEQGVSEQIILAMMQRQKNQVSDDFVYSVKYIDGKILLNEHIEVKKGDKLKVFLPYNMHTDFSSIKRKKSGFLKKLGSVADVVKTGALAVAVGSNDLGTTIDAIEVINKTSSVSWGVEALDKLDKLSISKDAKKIAGKTFEVTDIIIKEDGESILEGTIEKKKYTAELPNVFIFGELKVDMK